MAVIKVTQADLSANKVIGPVWVSSTITKVEGPLRAASGKSNNYFITYTFNENCEAPGKEVRVCYNDSRGLGSLHPVFASIRGIHVKDFKVGEELDTEELLNTELDVHAVPDVNNNQPFQNIDNYLPVGAGDNVTAF